MALLTTERVESHILNIWNIGDYKVKWQGGATYVYVVSSHDVLMYTLEPWKLNWYEHIGLAKDVKTFVFERKDKSPIEGYSVRLPELNVWPRERMSIWYNEVRDLVGYDEVGLLEQRLRIPDVDMWSVDQLKPVRHRNRLAGELWTWMTQSWDGWSKDDYQWDLNYNNIMIGNRGQYIVIDPIM